MDCQMWFETFRFCSKVSSKCRKCYFREPNFKHFPRGMPMDPLEICRHFGLSFLGRHPLLNRSQHATGSNPAQVNSYSADVSSCVRKSWNFLFYVIIIMGICKAWDQPTWRPSDPTIRKAGNDVNVSFRPNFIINVVSYLFIFCFSLTKGQCSKR